MPGYDDIVYKKNYLTQVIVRFDFVAPIQGLEMDLPQKLAANLTSGFPILEPQDARLFELNFGPVEAKQVQKSFKQYNLFGKEREKQLSLTSRFMFVVYTKYSKYEEMRKTVNDGITALVAEYPDTRVARFGLRYINTLDMNNIDPIDDWAKFISPDLLGPLRCFDRNKLTRWMQVTEMKCGDLDLRFQFGLPNPDHPSVVKRPVFVLDLDGYVQAAHEFAQSLQHMDKAHECIQDQFERSITEGLREHMDA
jgi:uncharacterized protein (TIGR04255 family)